MIDRKQWLINRKNYIGGSEISAILGFNPYKTAVDVYLDKTTEDIEETNSEAAHFGNLLEETVANEYARRTGNTVHIEPNIIMHPEYNFIACNIDRWVNEKEFILECKTASYNKMHEWGEEGTDQIPEHYLFQVAYYSMITGVNRVDLAVLIGGNDFRIYKYNKNETLERQLLFIARSFWENHVTKRIPPKAQNVADVAKIYPEDNKDSIIATFDIEQKLHELQELKQQAKVLEENIKNITIDVQNYMANNAILTTQDNKILATWKTSKGRASFNTKAFSQEMPDVYNKFLKANKPYRTFLIKDYK